MCVCVRVCVCVHVCERESASAVFFFLLLMVMVCVCAFLFPYTLGTPKGCSTGAMHACSHTHMYTLTLSLSLSLSLSHTHTEKYFSQVLFSQVTNIKNILCIFLLKFYSVTTVSKWTKIKHTLYIIQIHLA